MKKNWLVVWKMTWGIWQIFTRTLGNVKIGTFMGCFCPEQKMHELQIYRGVICNDIEEWWKTWRRIDLLFQNWHKEFDELWTEHSKVSKICTLMGCFYQSIQCCSLESTEELCLIALKINKAFERKLTRAFKKMTWGIWQIFTRELKSFKLGLWWDFLYKVEDV